MSMSDEQVSDPAWDTKGEYLWRTVDPSTNAFLALQKEGWSVGGGTTQGKQWLRKARASDPTLEKWMKRDAARLWNLYHLLQSNGHEEYGPGFLQTASFSDFANFVFCNSSPDLACRSSA